MWVELSGAFRKARKDHIIEKEENEEEVPISSTLLPVLVASRRARMAFWRFGVWGLARTHLSTAIAVGYVHLCEIRFTSDLDIRFGL